MLCQYLFPTLTVSAQKTLLINHLRRVFSSLLFLYDVLVYRLGAGYLSLSFSFEMQLEVGYINYFYIMLTELVQNSWLLAIDSFIFQFICHLSSIPLPPSLYF